jgi:hypothetical protein
VLYLSAEQFMYRFIQALREKQIMDFKGLFRSVDVLMVDDVQFIAGKESTQEEFFHTFNALVDQHKQIVISADRAPGEIKDLEDRIKSRACNAAWSSTCTRPTTSCASASCSRRSSFTASNIAGWCRPTGCWSSSPTASPPTSGCSRAR